MPYKVNTAGELPELTSAIERLRTAAAREGIEFTTADFGGLRTEADTVEILAIRQREWDSYAAAERARGRAPVPIATWRPVSRFGGSHHNWGAARDLRITKRPASVSYAAAQARLGALGATVGLRWGGKFPRPDPPHFELPITVSEARARWLARGNEIGGVARNVTLGVVLLAAVGIGLRLILGGR